jgi:hypothetical protein
MFFGAMTPMDFLDFRDNTEANIGPKLAVKNY